MISPASGLDAEASAATVSPWSSAVQRVAQRRNKHQALLSTAARWFQQQGFCSTSLDQVAKQLGITKPTLYYYVRSKDELVHACAMAGWQRAQASVEHALRAAQPSHALAAGLQAYASAVSSDFGWCMVRVDEYALPAKWARQLRQQRRALEQCLGPVAPACVPVAVMLRALEGVVLGAPRSAWMCLIDAWSRATLAEAAGAQQAHAVPAIVSATALPAAQALAQNTMPVPDRRLISHGMKKSFKKQQVDSNQSVDKQLTVRSVFQLGDVPEVAQISLF